ncbi:PEGA domain-containing protein [Kribbella karoonensis]|uniref:PEGA domain-containing protein n=1 Tax=Kribbella karoonensis TaxID=324851 RepID=A0ABN2E1R9_9ACTN
MEENRRLYVAGAAILVAVVLLVAFLVFRGGPEHKVQVSSVPNDLTLTVDGKQVAANGEIKVKEGQHTFVGQRKGFETYTETVDIRQDYALKMYLFSNNAEGRAWERSHPEQELQIQAETGRRFDELNKRLEAKYPILQQLPYIGRGFTINQGVSKAHPGDPEYLAFYIKLVYPEGRKYALEWLKGNGYDPDNLELIFTTS